MQNILLFMKMSLKRNDQLSITAEIVFSFNNMMLRIIRLNEYDISVLIIIKSK